MTNVLFCNVLLYFLIIKKYGHFTLLKYVYQMIPVTKDYHQQMATFSSCPQNLFVIEMANSDRSKYMANDIHTQTETHLFTNNHTQKMKHLNNTQILSFLYTNIYIYNILPHISGCHHSLLHLSCIRRE